MYRNIWKPTIIFVIIPLTILIFLPIHVFGQNIINPYQEIDWENINYYKANLQTHTEQSDGYHSVEKVITAFNANKYDILAITDHNTYTWPWSNYIDENEEKVLDMSAINATEISNTHHIGSYFNSYVGEDESETKVLDEIEKRDGLAVFFHPGRYSKTKEWYINFYEQYKHLVGQEIFNKNNRYPGDLEFWDKILYKLMPYRPVWGFANDDMHSIPRDLGGHYNIFLLEENTTKAVKSGMKNGHFYIYNPVRNREEPKFYIDNIIVEKNKIEISVKGDYRKIEWIAYDSVTEQNKIFAEGKIFKVDDLSYKSTYIRAKISSRAGDILTQPFGIVY